MKRFEIHKIDIVSAAKVYLVLGLFIGLFFGGLFLVTAHPFNAQNIFLAIIGLFIIILAYALISVGIVVVIIFIYNLIASKTGGVVIYVKEETYIAPERSNNPNKHKLT